MPVISITRLRVRSWRFLPSFFLYALRSANEATNADGNLAAKVLNDRRHTFWTLTAWSSEQVPKSFMVSGAHAVAMKKLLEWCDEASVARWVQESAELPSWPEAYARMQREGRPSKVNHPSPAHLAYRIDAPTSEAQRERIFFK